VAMFSAISLLASGAGAKPYALRECRTISLAGLDLAPASPSVPQGSSKDSRTIGTSGPCGSTSSASAALTESLGSKLRLLSGKAGSTLYAATWKRKATPAGRPYWAHTASGRRTSDSGSTGWQTPKAGDACESGATEKQQAGYPSVAREAQRALLPASGSDCIGWATPQASDWVEGIRTAPDSKQKCLGRDLKGLASGATASGLYSQEGRPARLNPGLSRWLMGFPKEWGNCVPTATPSPSSRKRRQRS
jgi:hypothetical protein